MPADAIEAAGPRAVLRVPEILQTVATRRGATLAELCQALDVPKTSLHRLLRTLESGGYLVSDAGRYSLGPTAFALSRSIAAAEPETAFPASARPVLEALAQATGETIMLGLLDARGDEIVYVEVLNSTAPVRFTVPVGDRRPLYSAAAGKAVLAFLPAAARDRYLDECDFAPFTSLTASRDRLLEELPEIIRTGVATDNGGKIVGAAGVSSPVFDASGAVCASVSAAGPAERLLSDRNIIDKAVLRAGEQISRLAGYSGRYPPEPN